MIAAQHISALSVAAGDVLQIVGDHPCNGREIIVPEQDEVRIIARDGIYPAWVSLKWVHGGLKADTEDRHGDVDFILLRRAVVGVPV